MRQPSGGRGGGCASVEGMPKGESAGGGPGWGVEEECSVWGWGAGRGWALRIKVCSLPGLGERVGVGVGLRTGPGSECEVPGWGTERRLPTSA